jgi:hypothetical protein
MMSYCLTCKEVLKGWWAYRDYPNGAYFHCTGCDEE